MQLSAASGQARCGRCKTQFNALTELLDKTPANRPKPSAENASPASASAQNIDLKHTQVSASLDSDIEQLDRDFDPISEIKALEPKGRSNRNSHSDSYFEAEMLDDLDLEQELGEQTEAQKAIEELEEIQTMGFDELSLDLSDDSISDADLGSNKAKSKKRKRAKSQRSLLEQNTSGLDGYIKDIDNTVIGEDVFKGSDRATLEERSTATLFTEEGKQTSPGNDYISKELGARNTPSSLMSNLLWVGLISLLVIVLLGQLVYFKRIDFAQNSMRPLVEMICNHVSAFTDCTIPAARDIQAIELTERDVRSHPQLNNTLLITASIISNATFSQPFPKMIMRFTNINQTVMADRLFEPNEYLGKDVDLDLGMQPGIPVKVKLEIVDPGPDAVSFEFDFK